MANIIISSPVTRNLSSEIKANVFNPLFEVYLETHAELVGKGRGNWGHEGVKGQRGGSAPSDGVSTDSKGQSAFNLDANGKQVKVIGYTKNGVAITESQFYTNTFIDSKKYLQWNEAKTILANDGIRTSRGAGGITASGVKSKLPLNDAHFDLNYRGWGMMYATKDGSERGYQKGNMRLILLGDANGTEFLLGKK